MTKTLKKSYHLPLSNIKVAWYVVSTTRALDKVETSVHRRFRDFAELNSQVKQNLKGHHLRASLPPLPDKTLKLYTDHNDLAFIQDRKFALESFLSNLVNMPHVPDMTCVKAFLGIMEQVREFSFIIHVPSLCLTLLPSEKAAARAAAAAAAAADMSPSSIPSLVPISSALLQMPAIVGGVQKPDFFVGLKPGDAISKINGDAVAGTTFSDVVSKLKTLPRPIILHFIQVIEVIGSGNSSLSIPSLSSSSSSSNQHQNQEQQKQEQNHVFISTSASSSATTGEGEEDVDGEGMMGRERGRGGGGVFDDVGAVEIEAQDAEGYRQRHHVDRERYAAKAIGAAPTLTPTPTPTESIAQSLVGGGVGVGVVRGPTSSSDAAAAGAGGGGGNVIERESGRRNNDLGGAKSTSSSSTISTGFSSSSSSSSSLSSPSLSTIIIGSSSDSHRTNEGIIRSGGAKPKLPKGFAADDDIHDVDI